ncbi:hypothetical protein, conserved [Leishmania tarentolae]|uniref:Uncharacterized protein n=1 Tax=Leishmania tarentolae TaxID=5689 RepID=A0A640KS27_LEITA|nr:hypothetical protein, conserved [Leishmania tarentolae]
MVKQTSRQLPLRLPSRQARNESHSIDSDRKHKCFSSLRVVGAPAGQPSPALADAQLRRKYVPTVPTTPRRAKGYTSAWNLGHGCFGTTPDNDGNGAREHLQHWPSSKGQGNNIEHRSYSAGVSPDAQRPANDMLTSGLQRRSTSLQVVASVSENELSSDDVLLLCGVKPGSSKALWYTTMRAQLEARALATSTEHSDRGDSATRNGATTRVGSSSSSNLPAHRADPSSEPLLLPMELLLLADLSELNSHHAKESNSVAHQVQRLSRSFSGEGDTEDGEEEDEGASSLGDRSISICSEKEASTSVRQGTFNAAPQASLKNLRLSPKQLTQMRVVVLSLRRLADL